jgi:hypothetical protein|tara:strand:+ start:4677 stop:4814 length:138 start_codon:yes stop_codon:yes gene_type:complete
MAVDINFNDKEIKILLEIINSVNYKGSDIEQIYAIKQKFYKKKSS